MAQSAALVDSLKWALRAHGVTYAAVAKELRLSEASIKRMFSRRSFTLSRLDAILAMIHMDLTDLLEEMSGEAHRITRLSPAQEQELVSDIKLLLVAVCARNHWGFKDIVAQYELTESECTRLLAKLDRLGLIELLPGNRIKLRVSEDFRWIPEGPIERFFEARVQKELLDSGFHGDHEHRLFLFGTLSPASQEVFARRLETLAREFAEHHKADNKLPIGERSNVGVVLAMRPWEFKAFRELRKKATKNRQGQNA